MTTSSSSTILTFTSLLVLSVIFLSSCQVIPTPTNVTSLLSLLSETDFEANGPDTDTGESLCPRNRDEATFRGRRCLRKCRTDAGCISTRKRCLCDGLCGWSCVRPDLNCDELPSILHGSFQVTGDYFGARITYSCDEGYFMSGHRERVCQGDGSWSDSPPTCREEAMCGEPNAVPHARHDAPIDKKEFAIDAIVEYECFVGYESKGFSKAMCLFYNGTAQWFGPEFKCIPISCGDPGDLENGRREGSEFTFTGKVTYSCEEGYELIGHSNRYCQSNGQWSGSIPSCLPVKCPEPERFFNGRMDYSSRSYNSLVRYECPDGFKLNGPSTRRCGPSKEWEGNQPKCEVIDCGHPGALPNGYVNLVDGRRTSLGSVAHFKCVEGTTFVGSNTSTCLDTGFWSNPLPSCMAPCVVPEVDNGRVNGDPGKKVSHGEEIQVVCKPQYELKYNSSGARCHNGSWIQMPVCVPERCKQLPDQPKNGLVIAPKMDHGMKALFRCKDGFTLVGNMTTTCNFGRWIDPTPSCQEIYCPFPGVLEHGRILLVGHMGRYDYRSYVRKVGNKKQVTYECEKGYFVQGPPGSTCLDGHWSPRELPKCVKGYHPPFLAL